MTWSVLLLSLALEEKASNYVLFQTASISEQNYMAFRCWVGIWLSLICALTAVFELSFVLKYFTRFTEEIFAMLVSLIFCVSVIKSLMQVPKYFFYFAPIFQLFSKFTQLTPQQFGCDKVKSGIFVCIVAKNSQQLFTRRILKIQISSMYRVNPSLHW